jgi:hypothetical protein
MITTPTPRQCPAVIFSHRCDCHVVSLVEARQRCGVMPVKLVKREQCCVPQGHGDSGCTYWRRGWSDSTLTTPRSLYVVTHLPPTDPSHHNRLLDGEA